MDEMMSFVEFQDYCKEKGYRYKKEIIEYYIRKYPKKVFIKVKGRGNVRYIRLLDVPGFIREMEKTRNSRNVI